MPTYRHASRNGLKKYPGKIIIGVHTNGARAPPQGWEWIPITSGPVDGRTTIQRELSCTWRHVRGGCGLGTKGQRLVVQDVHHMCSKVMMISHGVPPHPLDGQPPSYASRASPLIVMRLTGVGCPPSCACCCSPSMVLLQLFACHASAYIILY